MKKAFFLVLAIATSFTLVSQDKLLTIQDAVLKGRTTLAPKRLQGLSFVTGSDKFAYIENNVVKVGDNATGKMTDFVRMNDINKILKAEKRDSLKQIIILEWKNEKQFYFLSGILELIYDAGSKKVLDTDRKQNDKTLESYDELNNSTYAYTENHNLYIHQKDSNYQITKDGSYTIEYGKSVHRDEFGIHKGTYWSPSGNFLAFYRMDQSDVTDYPIIDWTKYPAENNNMKYPMAGRKVIMLLWYL
ncbi:MAG: DPP IV N-terminal domain-containing protein [Sphingobacteriaceae bacterium]|nr:DPP IV N-terminal domain-containing protein [Sphingobacteriaceae bacterium]